MVSSELQLENQVHLVENGKKGKTIQVEKTVCAIALEYESTFCIILSQYLHLLCAQHCVMLGDNETHQDDLCSYGA